MTDNKLTHRYIARIGLEAMTPLFVGSGESSLLTDALVQKDSNGLPMIPGTAITGVIRHAMESAAETKCSIKDIFGYEDKNDGVGSRLLISHAYMVLENNIVAEGLDHFISESFQNKFDNLPTRQHVRINDKGVAEKHGLFNNELVYQGVRFVFEMELKGSDNDDKCWGCLLKTIQSPMFRIGQGTRNGFGNLEATVFFEKTFDLKKDFNEYLDFNPSLNYITPVFGRKASIDSMQLTHYELELTPENTFIFSSGIPDNEVDNTPIVEEVIVYKNDGIDFEEKTLIPATSIKGALSHRLAFHYNKIMGNYIANPKAHTAIDNDAVYQIFGSEANPDSELRKRESGHRGRLIMSDVFIEANNEKIFNHVAIDRFTGGAIDGALFSEKVSRLPHDKTVTLNMYLEKTKTLDSTIINALEDTLIDVCSAMLPLGGLTTKGHGFFEGTLKKDGKIIYPKTNKDE